MKRYIFDKLVRDKIPAILRDQGCFPEERVLDKDEYIKMLKRKLQEEVQEALEAKNSSELIEELADILEVIHATAQAHAIPFQTVEEKRLVKREARGGFDARIYIPHIDLSASNPQC